MEMFMDLQTAPKKTKSKQATNKKKQPKRCHVMKKYENLRLLWAKWKIII